LSQISSGEAESTRENISNAVLTGEVKKVGSAIQACRKRKPNGGRVKLLPLALHNKENVHPNQPTQITTETGREP